MVTLFDPALGHCPLLGPTAHHCLSCKNPLVAAATSDQLSFEGAKLELPEGQTALSLDLGTEGTFKVPSALISPDLVSDGSQQPGT